MNTSVLDKIHNRYDPDNDLGPDAPIHWSVDELADLIGKMVDKIELLENQVANLLEAIPSADRLK